MFLNTFLFNFENSKQKKFENIKKKPRRENQQRARGKAAVETDERIDRGEELFFFSRTKKIKISFWKKKSAPKIFFVNLKQKFSCFLFQKQFFSIKTLKKKDVHDSPRDMGHGEGGEQEQRGHNEGACFIIFFLKQNFEKTFLNKY